MRPASSAKSCQAVIFGRPRARAASEPPGSQEVLSVVDPMALVECDDALDAILVAVGIGDRRIGREVEAVGLEDQVVSDPSRRGQVLLQSQVTSSAIHPSCRSPPRLAGSTGNSRGRPDVDARQVADRVVELGIAQPPRQYAAGVARVFPGFARRATALIQSMTARRSWAAG